MFYEVDKNPSGGYLALTGMILVLGGNGLIRKWLQYRTKTLKSHDDVQISNNRVVQDLLRRLQKLEGEVDELRLELAAEKRKHEESKTRLEGICASLRYQLSSAQRRIRALLHENGMLRDNLKTKEGQS